MEDKIGVSDSVCIQLIGPDGEIKQEVTNDEIIKEEE